jgi:hypothetical protein
MMTNSTKQAQILNSQSEILTSNKSQNNCYLFNALHHGATQAAGQLS